MSNAGDAQDMAEALDVDKIDDDRAGEDELDDYPPDRPLAVDDYGVTEAEEAIDEPLEERVRREEPDPLVIELERRASLPENDDHLILVDDDDADTMTADMALGEQTAEEAAIHVVDEP